MPWPYAYGYILFDGRLERETSPLAGVSPIEIKGIYFLSEVGKDSNLDLFLGGLKER